MESSPRFFATPATFRRWLERHHDSATELWVGFWKKDSGRKGMTYVEAVDEALCYGWIDWPREGQRRALLQAALHPAQAAEHLERDQHRQGRAPGGRGTHGGARPGGVREARPKRTGLYSFENRDVKLSAAFGKRFRADRAAWAFFSKQPPGYRRLAAFWVMKAKQEATRERRLAKLVADSAAGRRVGSVTGKKDGGAS
jgi:hypothetical protein